VIGTRQKNDAISFPVEGVDGGSISMLAVRVSSAERDNRRATLPR
jgi:hypothetical protein